MTLKSTSEQVELGDKNFQIHVKPSKRKKIRKVKVTLEGELNIYNVKEIREAVLPIFSDYDFIDFYLDNIREIDFSFIQFLYYIQSIKAEENKTVTIDCRLSTEIKQMVTFLGYNDLLIKPKLA